MARERYRLSAKDVKGKAPGMYSDGGGLWLQVTAGKDGEAGGRSWVYRFMLRGRARTMGLGPLADVSLAEARGKAAAARNLVRDGIDPIEHREKARAAQALSDASAMTFQQAAEAFIAANEAGWRNEVHRKQWPSTLKAYVYPTIGALPVAAVNTAHVMKVLEQAVAGIDGKPERLWTAKRETALRLRGRIEKVLDWAKAREYRTGENPARWRGHLQNLLPNVNKVRGVEHHAALPFDDVGEFMAALRQQEGVAARMLAFTILTAARTGEAMGATWDEIDLHARQWTIPASRMKGGREHRVPLSEAALADVRQQLAHRPEGENYIFPSRRRGVPLSNMAMAKVLERMGYDVTVHGFRSTFRDWAAERTGFPNHVVEMALSHVVGDKVEAAYRRGDLLQKRRHLMDAWAKYCGEPKRRMGVVVPMMAEPKRSRR